VVAVSLINKSERALLAALIAGERDARILAGLALGTMRKKAALLEEAFTGDFTQHHAFLLSRMLARVDGITEDMTVLQERIDEHVAGFRDAVNRLDDIPGIAVTGAQAILAEIGLDMTRFPTPAHLASWAKFAPGIIESAGRKKGGSATGHGNPYLARALGEAAVAASRTNTFLGERYRRIARRRGAKRAVVAVGRSILIIIWHLLNDPGARFVDLGPGFFDTHINSSRRVRNHVRELQSLGYRVILEAAA